MELVGTNWKRDKTGVGNQRVMGFRTLASAADDRHQRSAESGTGFGFRVSGKNPADVRPQGSVVSD